MKRLRAESMAVALFGAAFVVVAMLSIQALITLRAHERVVDSTLEDFAGFAAEGISAELNTMFATIFLDLISVSRAAHYTGSAVPADEVTRDSELRRVLNDMVPAYFSLVGDSVVTRDGVIDRETRDWIRERVGNHARDVYPRPAPYALLQSVGSDGTRTVVYRREEAYEGVAIYGFLVDFGAAAPLYRSVLSSSPVLPQSLAQSLDPADLLTIHLSLPPYDEVLYSFGTPQIGDLVRSQSFAAKAGRIAVRVEMDAYRTRALIGGSRVSQIPLFLTLTALTLGLFFMAVVVMRRAARVGRMREVFVENVSHDLRTPLAQIRMFSETLLLGRLDDESERTRSLQIIRRQAMSLSDMVENILDASTRSTAPLRRESTRVRDLVSDTLDGLRPLARERGIHITADVRGPDDVTLAPTALRRIVTNLVDNSIKHGPAGQTVTVRVEQSDRALEIIVEDGGGGVPVSERARVWERFYRVDNPDRSVTGAGVGLSVVRTLAERHGGSAHFEESENGGARVRVVLAVEIDESTLPPNSGARPLRSKAAPA